jgi:acyl-CoA reductase-like NAD-dependent aldehyde dehydrogenase
MLHLAQAAVAFALLIGLPIVLEPPSTDERMIAAAFGALFLAALAAHGVLGYVRSRKPRSYHDSIMPPIESAKDAKPKA